ncbi:MAG: TDP-N-acetylfucosamine:lipid II N-acetylfucosaminyltransferase [Bacteroidetes bacterium]|nr:TDP-N-acetylfucosamine:lipid II N-acetylfucosaminyltransferase [Bacteroidota bacterium]
MILHLLIDSKFTDYAIDQFEAAAPGNNNFVVFIPNENYKCIHIKQNHKIDLVPNNSPEFDKLIDNLHIYKAIITHGLFLDQQENVILKTPLHVKKAWVFWGAEFYNRLEYERKYLGNHSRRIYELHLFKQRIKSYLSLLFFKEKYKFSYQVNKETFALIDYCLTDISEDYEIVKNKLNCKFESVWYNYYSIEHTIGNLKNEMVSSNNIFIGNSSTITNNHLEIFNILKDFNLKNRKIIVPLNYGDMYYRKIILKKGIKDFGDTFSPILELLQLEDYNKLLLTSSIFIMNHYRPQAMGNIITALWLGGRVYLSKKNVLYNYFKRLGCNIYSIEDNLKPGNKESLEKLHFDEVMHNREILTKEYGNENVMSKVEDLVKVLLS